MRERWCGEVGDDYGIFGVKMSPLGNENEPLKEVEYWLFFRQFAGNNCLYTGGDGIDYRLVVTIEFFTSKVTLWQSKLGCLLIYCTKATECINYGHSQKNVFFCKLCTEISVNCG